jgi:RNA polymerase sigma factor (sigma-70 family)
MLRTNNQLGAARSLDVARDVSYEPYTEVVESSVAAVSRQYHLTRWQADELRSETWLKLVRTGWLAVSRFRGESRLQTYLMAVVRNVLRDQRNKEWGKWRPSLKGRRLGPLAVATERLVNRDHVPPTMIPQLVRPRSEAERVMIADFATALSRRPFRQMITADILERMPSQEPSPFDLASRNERRATRLRTNLALRRALAGLTGRERSLIVWRYFDGRTIADYVSAAGLDGKRVYREFARALKRLRAGLEGQGIYSSELADNEPADGRNCDHSHE